MADFIFISFRFAFLRNRCFHREGWGESVHYCPVLGAAENFWASEHFERALGISMLFISEAFTGRIIISYFLFLKDKIFLTQRWHRKLLARRNKFLKLDMYLAERYRQSI